MEENNLKKEKVEKYLKDIALIKQRMNEVEDVSLFEPWAHMIWGLSILAGTLLHYFLYKNRTLPGFTGVVLIWIPVCIICGITEIITTIRAFTKGGIPLRTRHFVQFLISIWCMLIITFIFAFIMIKAGALSPGLILFLGSMAFLSYSMYAYADFFILGIALFILGLIFFLLHANSPIYYLSGGLLLGSGFCVYGMAGKRKHAKGA